MLRLFNEKELYFTNGDEEKVVVNKYILVRKWLQQLHPHKLHLPEFRRFNIDDEKTSFGIKWKVWLAEFENLLIALNITNAKRQRALMLYYARNDVHEIYRSLVNTEDAKRRF